MAVSNKKSYGFIYNNIEKNENYCYSILSLVSHLSSASHKNPDLRKTVVDVDICARATSGIHYNREQISRRSCAARRMRYTREYSPSPCPIPFSRSCNGRITSKISSRVKRTHVAGIQHAHEPRQCFLYFLSFFTSLGRQAGRQAKEKD